MPKFAPVSEWFRNGRKQERNASLAQYTCLIRAVTRVAKWG